MYIFCNGFTLFLSLRNQNGLSAVDWVSGEISTLLHITSDRGWWWWWWWGWGEISGANSHHRWGRLMGAKEAATRASFHSSRARLTLQGPRGAAQQRWTCFTLHLETESDREAVRDDRTSAWRGGHGKLKWWRWNRKQFCLQVKFFFLKKEKIYFNNDIEMKFSLKIALHFNFTPLENELAAH